MTGDMYVYKCRAEWRRDLWTNGSHIVTSPEDEAQIKELISSNPEDYKLVCVVPKGAAERRIRK